MRPYKFVIFAYLEAVAVLPLAALMNIDLQVLLREPLLKIRFVDLAIIVSVLFAIYDALKGFQSLRRLNLVQVLILLYILLDLFNLSNTYGEAPVEQQMTWFLATLGLLIVYRLSTFTITPDIYEYIFKIAKFGAVIVLINFITILYGLKAGFTVDNEGRLLLIVSGQKEIITTSIIEPLVLVIGLIGLQLKDIWWKKSIYIIGIGTILANLAITFHRGTLTMVFLTFLFFLIQGKRNSVATIWTRLIITVCVVIATYFATKDIFSAYNIDPIEAIIHTTEFAVDTENESWDKGRRYVQVRILDMWQQKPWIGWGYDTTEKYIIGSAAHNFLVTSLFHRGIIGTLLLLGILGYSYGKGIKLWRLSKYLSHEEKLLNRGLVFISFLWLIPALTQEILWERYTMSMQYVYFGLIIALCNYYSNNSYSYQYQYTEAEYIPA